MSIYKHNIYNKIILIISQNIFDIFEIVDKKKKFFFLYFHKKNKKIVEIIRKIIPYCFIY